MPLVAKCSVYRLFIVIWNCFGFALLCSLVLFDLKLIQNYNKQIKLALTRSPVRLHTVCCELRLVPCHIYLCSRHYDFGFQFMTWFYEYDFRGTYCISFFYVLARIPPDPTIFEQRCVASQGCLLLLYLKQHLKEMYGFSDRLEFPVNYFSWLSMIYWYKVQDYSVIYELNWKCWMVNLARFLIRSFER